VQTVRFRIDRDAIDGIQLRKQFGELLVGVDHRVSTKLQAPSSREIPSTKQQTIAAV
jgi:hypothetical protein